MIGPIYRWWYYRRWNRPENRALLLWVETKGYPIHPNPGEWPSEFFARLQFYEDLLEVQAEIERTAERRETAWLN